MIKWLKFEYMKGKNEGRKGRKLDEGILRKNENEKEEEKE